ncbi:ribonuclease VapC [Alphaproteobacteria bacterium]|nr:ribonuclease VapC [Alphaproteobacteria bacterium]
MTYLLDTCVLSESRRSQMNPCLKKWLASAPDEALYISVLSLGEIRCGVERLKDAARRDKLAAWLEHELLAWFENRVLPLDAEVLNRWGFICANCRTLPVIDSLLAATALTRRLTIATRNIKDFQGIEGLKIINPWEV